MRHLTTTFFLAAFLIVGFTPALAQNEGPPALPALEQDEKPPALPGNVEGTGTYFEVTDSEYLNVTLASSDLIVLSLESVPSTIVMHFEAADGAPSTQVTLGGLAPSTTYYKYEDSYENGEAIATDASGEYGWRQDLSGPHLVWLQPNPSTKFIRDDATGGDCASIGDWDGSTKTCTLTTNVVSTIEISNNNITLNGAGHTVQGSGSSHGIFLSQHIGVTIKNVNVVGFYHGILLYSSSSNTLTGNTVSNDFSGIYLHSSSSNTLTANAASNNRYGIYLFNSHSNMLAGNTASDSSRYGIYFGDSSGNTLTANTVSNNVDGIYFSRSSNNTLTGNTVFNYRFGISLTYYSSSNELTDNTASNNFYGIFVSLGTSNQIYNNNFISNTISARISCCGGNLFNLSAPIGGNFWSDWTTPDNNNDGFVDSPYAFYGGQDDLPWTTPNGWLSQAPVADAGENIQILSAEQAYTSILGIATDPSEDVLEYRWLKGDELLLDWSLVGTSGEATLDLAPLPYFPLGSHTLTLQVREVSGDHTTTDTMVLTIDNSPPEVQPAPSTQVVEVGIDPIQAIADAGDFDGDTLTYEWRKEGELLDSGSVTTVQGGATVAIPDLLVQAGDSRFPVGTHAIELRVNDGVNDPVSAFVSVEVTDTTAPSLSPLPSVTMLWPPNHAMVPLTIAANAFDNGGGPITLTVSITSSEPPDFDGDGHTIPDYVLDSVDDTTGMIELRLRSERSGQGEGRTYTVHITATDENRNQSQATVGIRAPHDRKK